MDSELETLQRIAKQADANGVFQLNSSDVPFALTLQGQKWLKQIEISPPLYKLSDAGKKQLGP